MVICNSCGTENTDGAKFCVRCGSSLTAAAASSAAPEPGAWRDPSAPVGSGGLNEPMRQENLGGPPPVADPYAVPPPPLSSAPPPPYAPPAAYNPYGQQPNAGQYPPPAAGEPMHPAVPAIVSLFFPGIGLLFLPNKAGLGIGLFVGYLVLNIVLVVLTVITFGLGGCLYLLVPLVNILAAVHSWDEAAKVSGGKFQPLLFK